MRCIFFWILGCPVIIKSYPIPTLKFSTRVLVMLSTQAAMVTCDAVASFAFDVQTKQDSLMVHLLQLHSYYNRFNKACGSYAKFVTETPLSFGFIFFHISDQAQLHDTEIKPSAWPVTVRQILLKIAPFHGHADVKLLGKIVVFRVRFLTIYDVCADTFSNKVVFADLKITTSNYWVCFPSVWSICAAASISCSHTVNRFVVEAELL